MTEEAELIRKRADMQVAAGQFRYVHTYIPILGSVEKQKPALSASMSPSGSERLRKMHLVEDNISATLPRSR